MSRTDIPVVVKTQAANFSVGTGDWGAVHVITAAVTATLPAVSTVPAGTWIEFYLIVDENLVIAGTDEEVVLYNNATADSITFGQTGEQIGAGCRVISDGSSWLVQNHLADEANSITVGDA